MKKLINILTSFIIFIFLGVAIAENYPDDISKWITVTPPTESTSSMAANWSTHEWRVVLENGVVYARQRNIEEVSGEKPDFKIPASKEMNGERHYILVPDGWLVGFNAGEWGGSLWWFSATGKDYYKISDDQIVSFLKRDGEIMGIEGLAHLGISKGNIIKVEKNKDTGKYVSLQILNLNAAPEAAILDTDNSVIVVTTSGLFRASGDKLTKIVDGFWLTLYPNSIVVDAQRNAYIGMRQGVAKISLSDSNQKIDWLVPSKQYLDDEMKSYQERSK